mmetsp:Transcript_17916/g.26661  ORF Transcript_17916/g.26661 Transcript_17916/m.26661 type:complete len:108 (-) Transcript_17916:1200-1523(-)
MISIAIRRFGTGNYDSIKEASGFSTAVSTGSRDEFAKAAPPMPVTLLTDDERMIQDSVRKWANHDLKPLVREMEKNELISPSIIQELYTQGYMSLEIPEEYGGVGKE